jgi:DNA-binding transcriptional LysR family regulator
MDLGQLEIFLCIADEKSFSRAAEKVRRTQPALSIAIKRLEVELGEPLFDRSSKGGMLTEAGRVLYSYAQRMVNLREEAREAINELRGMYQGRLTIGANESTSLYLLPQLLVEYRRRYPQIKIEVHRAVSERIPTEVYERNLDMGFLSFDPTQTGLQSIEVERDELVLVVPPGHRLLERKRVTVRSPARDRIFELFRHHQTPLNICVELSILETIKDFVGLGVGLAILPRLSVQESIESGRLCPVRVEGMKIEKTLRLVFRREETLSHAARAFLRLVRETRSISPTKELPPRPQR